MPDIHLDVAVPAFVILLAALLAGLLAFLSYRSTVPAVSLLRRSLLTVLRGSALFFILLIILEPVLLLTSSSTDLPRIAVLVDDSKSMRIADRAGLRSATIGSLLQSDAMRSLKRDAQLQYYTVGIGLHQFDPDKQDSLLFAQEGTDLSAALRSLQREQAVHHFDAAILLSDGTYTLGQNPAYEAEEAGLPVFTVGIGDSSEHRDLLVSGLLANSTAFSETPTPVDVRIRTSGFGDTSADVRLLQGTRELARTTIRLEPGTHDYSVTLAYTPADEGLIRYTAEVVPQRGELTELNNKKSFAVRVLKSRVRLLVFAGSPGPDLTVLRQTLHEEKAFSVRAFTQTGTGEFFEGQVTGDAVDSADCIILIGFPTASTAGGILERISRASGEKTPLLFIAGKAIDHTKLRAIAGALPFTVDLPSTVEQLVSCQPALAQKDHPLLALERQDALTAWSRLPPVFRTLTVFRAKQEALVLATGNANGIPVQDPVLVVRSIGRQRAVAVLAYGVWRWKLMAQGDPQTATLYAAFLSTAIRWLTSPPDARRLRVQASKDLYVQGETVEFLGQAYDATMKPRDDARITVSVASGERIIDTELRPAGNGRYDGKLDGLGEGEYRYQAVGEAGGEALGQDEGRFRVGEPSLEFQDTRSSPSVLRQLAARTGGVFFSPAGFDSISAVLASHTSLAPHNIRRSHRIEIWNWEALLICVVLLFAAEWILRRRSGLL